MFALIKQIEEIIEQNRAQNAEISDIEFQKKVVHGYHVANLSCANFQLSLKTMQHSSSEMQFAVSFLEKVFITSFRSKMLHSKFFILKTYEIKIFF